MSVLQVTDDVAVVVEHVTAVTVHQWFDPCWSATGSWSVRVFLRGCGKRSWISVGEWSYDVVRDGEASRMMAEAQARSLAALVIGSLP